MKKKKLEQRIEDLENEVIRLKAQCSPGVVALTSLSVIQDMCKKRIDQWLERDDDSNSV